MLIKAHWLSGTTVAAIDCNSFAAELIGQFVGFIDGCGGCIFREVYGFADRCVAVLLEGGLHFNVPFGLDIVSTFENFAYLGWDLGDLLDTSGFCNLILEYFVIEAGFQSDSFENGIYLAQFCAGQYLTYKDQ